MSIDGRRMILATVALVALCMPAWAAPLKVMSFNIRGDFDLEEASNSPEAWNSLSNMHRRDLVAKTIDDARPDVLGVQEAFRHQLFDLEKSLTGYAYYGVGRDDGQAAGEHSAILYRADRFRRVNQGTFWLSDSPDEAGSKHPDAACTRIASWVILAEREADEQEYFVLNTHWDHVSDAARLHAVKVIRSRLAKVAAGRPAVVMGDMNAREDDAAITTLLGQDDFAGLQLLDSFRERVPRRGKEEATFHNFAGNPTGSRIDYILHSPDLRATEAAIVRRKFDDRFPSDHFPVTATLVPASVAAGEASTTAPR